MKKNTKGKIIIGVILLIILFIGIISITIFLNNKNNTTNDTNTNTNKNNETIKNNTNKGVVEDKEIDGITFTNIKCTYDGSYSILKYTITNHNNQDINLGEYEIVVKDKDGNVLANIAPTLDYTLKKEEAYDTENIIDIDLSTAFSIELIINNN